MDTQQALELADAHRRVGRLKEAGQLYAEVLRGEPDHAEALCQLGRIAAALGQQQAAIGFLNKVVKRQPAHPEAAFELATALVAIGQSAAGLAWYRAQLEANPTHAAAIAGLERLLVQRRDTDGLLELATELMRQAQFEPAERAARAAAAIDPRRGASQLLLGMLLARLSPAHPAPGLLRRGLADAPGHAGGWARLASALAGQGRVEAALEQARRAAAAAGNEAATLLEAGRLLLATGDASRAETCFRRLLAERAGDAKAKLALISALINRKETGAAIRLARSVLVEEADNIEASALLGAAFATQGASAGAAGLIRTDLRAGRHQQALAAALAVCRIEPERAEARVLVGMAAHELGRSAAGLPQLRSGLALAPMDLQGAATLGRAYACVGARDDAWLWLRRAATLQGHDQRLGLDLVEVALETGRDAEARRLFVALPSDRQALPDAILRRAAICCRLGRSDDGMALAWHLLEARPEHAATTEWLTRQLAGQAAPETLIRLALLHQEAGRAGLAAIALRTFMQFEPSNAQSIYLLGRALVEGDPKTAGKLLARLAHLGPLDAGLMLSAGEWLADLKRYDTAVALMTRAIESKFEDSSNHRYAFFFNFLNQCDWPGRARYVERFTRLAEAKFAADDPSFQVNPSIFVFLGADEGPLLRSARHFARHSFPKHSPKAVSRARPSDRPLRIGYLSLFLSNHHIGYSQIEILKAYDPKAIEVFAYSAPREGDPIQAEVKRHLAAFREIDRPEPERIARMIAADGIDVLVDLDGYVNGIDGLLTMAVLSHRPAPVQMLFHNYVGPSGTNFVDYVVGDSVLFPPGTDAFYSEKLIRLPPCYYPAPPMPIADQQGERSDWGLPATGMVFANFGHFYKIEASCFEVWMRVLKRVPGSVMWFNHWEQPTAVKNLRRWAEAHAVDPDRLIFGSRVDKHLHLARLRHADLFLDTLVYSSGVTSIDALWAGVPVLTVAGGSFARRVSASLNAGIGMEALTCASAGEFEETAVRLAQNPTELARLRRRLWENRKTAPLFNQPVLARNLQQAFSEAWALHQSGAPPRAIDLALPLALKQTASD